MALYLDSKEISDFAQRIPAIPEHRWYPVYCRPNKEKAFTEFAAGQNISCYMPEIMRCRITRGKRIATSAAMFTGYVFVCTTRQQHWTVKQSKHIIRVLPVAECDEELLVAELNIIRTFEELAKTQQIEVRPEIVPGKKVVISQGRLQGIEGIVFKRKNSREIIVHLDFLGQSLATVEAYDLELL